MIFVLNRVILKRKINSFQYLFSVQKILVLTLYYYLINLIIGNMYIYKGLGFFMFLKFNFLSLLLGAESENKIY